MIYFPLPHSRRNNEGGEECVGTVEYMCASEMAEVNSQVTTTLLQSSELRLTEIDLTRQTSVSHSAAKIGPISDVIYCSPSLVSAVSQSQSVLG